MKAVWESKRIGDLLIDNQKSKLKVRDSISNGAFPFYTSGVSTSSFDEYLCDGKTSSLQQAGRHAFNTTKGKPPTRQIAIPVTNGREANPKFLFYFLNSVLKDIEDQMFEGAALRHLQKSKFREIAIRLPPLLEQQRIVGILDEVFDGIAIAKANADKNALNAAAIYESMLDKLFTDQLGKCGTTELGELIDSLTDYHANGAYETLKKHVELKNCEDYAWMVRSTDFENEFQTRNGTSQNQLTSF